jgi:para-nitrobenzyl esterase
MVQSTPKLTRRSIVSSATALLAMPAILRSSPADAAAEPAVVEIANGKLGGVKDNGAISFKGIPYAADTGGANRFMAPRPVANWTGVRDATQWGDRCMQPVLQFPTAFAWYPAQGTPLTENCCVLNVYTPDLTASARRPVMFYIHGGGFSRGAGQGAYLEGGNLAKFGDAVVVTLNHRINAFGYTNLGFLNPDFADAANVGQLDLVAALQWVKTNIHIFGGDPGNVTLFGQSGGGSKINTLLVMPAAKGLFRRAINMSGSTQFEIVPSSATEPLTAQILKTLEIDKSNLRKLQEVPADKLLAAHYASVRALKTDDSQPAVDGRHVVASPISPDGLAMHASVPLMFGETESEARWFMRDLRNFKVNEQQVKARIMGQYGVDEAKASATMAAFRKNAPDRSAADVLMAVASEGLVRVPMHRAADAISSSKHATLYFYDFAWMSPVDGGIWGSPHTADIPFAFGTVDAAAAMTGGGAAPTQISRAVMSAFMAFARTDNPSNPAMPEWKPYDPTNRQSMLIAEKPQMVNDYHGDDRIASLALGNQSVGEIGRGPIFQYSE